VDVVAADELGGRDHAMTELPVDPHLVSFLRPSSFEGEQYRALRHTIEHARRTTRVSVLAVSSATVGDGKTTTLINLAGALAQAPDVRVLVADADLRRPSVATRLGLRESGAPGLIDAIADDTLTLKDVVRHHPLFNLSVLSAGGGSSTPYEVLKSPRVGTLFDEARETFDYVLVDTPPLVPLADCRILGKWVDAFLVVVAAHKTPRKLVSEAMSILDAERVLGLVFNYDDRAVAGYYYGYSSYADSAREDWTTRAQTRVERFGVAWRDRWQRRRWRRATRPS
jgi:capsular exopolysaccharide synthesis family protein